MKLYEHPSFPNPRRVRIFLAEKGVEVERVTIDVPAGEHRKAPFIDKNPFAEIPALELDDGSCISESAAISRYFEEQHPQPALMGVGAEQKARIEMWQRRVESSLMNAVASYFHHATPGLGELETYQNPDWGQRCRDRALATMKLLDDELAGREFIAGDEFSIADITALCAIDFAKAIEIAIPDGHDNLQRWHTTVSSRPSASA